ncbi:PP2C family protein-serine/threonine phosphatase [Streptomyces bicolor]|uniref:PP2C family protein-serine/threonine phosphatase n=1 Tax=Streptomyces bicolor TaxID=66874 RepID=UPI0009982D0B|nr:SpoIIE family protein phosphatase [Streptomyces bicolor]
MPSCTGSTSRCAGVAPARQRERTRRHLVRANSVAEAMQWTLLRPVPRRLGPVRAAGFYEAGEGGTLVGGDLYDVCETPCGVRAIIGDVRGKGLDGVQTVAAVLGSFRVSAPPDGGEVRIVDRGHPAPLVIGPHGARRLLTTPALPLGLGALAPDGEATTMHPLAPSEVLVLHTDGVSEARDADHWSARSDNDHRAVLALSVEDVTPPRQAPRDPGSAARAPRHRQSTALPPPVELGLAASRSRRRRGISLDTKQARSRCPSAGGDLPAARARPGP